MTRRICLICLVVLMGATTLAVAHRITSGLTTLESNPRTGTVEITHRLFAHDLGPALSSQFNEQIDLNAIEEFFPQIEAYVSERFAVNGKDGTPLSLIWIGTELEADTVLIYQELTLPKDIAGLQITNRLLIPELDGQVNTVNVFIDETRETLTFTADEEMQTVAF